MNITEAKKLLYHCACFTLVVLELFFSTSAAKPVQAQAVKKSLGPGWVYVATRETVTVDESTEYDYDALYVINSFTNEKFGPFLREELSGHNKYNGNPDGKDLMDVAITPDGKTLLVTSFTKKLIHFVDVSSPLNPVYLTSIAFDFYAEDIAISADGKYALVTDGNENKTIVSVDIQNHVILQTFELPKWNLDGIGLIQGYAQAVAIAPDGTVVAADYVFGVLHALILDAAGELTYQGSYPLYVSSEGTVSDDPSVLPTGSHFNSARAGGSDLLKQNSPSAATGDITPAEVSWRSLMPVNVSISPDGKTVLAGDVRSSVDIYSADLLDNQYVVGRWKITEPGVLEWVDAFTGLNYAMQSITFSSDSNYAMMLGNQSITSDASEKSGFVYHNDAVVIVDLTPDAQGAYEPVRTVELKHSTSAQLFGVDGIVFYEGKIYASYSTISDSHLTFPKRYVAVIDFDTLAIENIEWGPFADCVPLGMDVKPFIPFRNFFPEITRN